MSTFNTNHIISQSNQENNQNYNQLVNNSSNSKMIVMNKVKKQKEPDAVDQIVENVLTEQRRKDAAKLAFELTDKKTDPFSYSTIQSQNSNQLFSNSGIKDNSLNLTDYSHHNSQDNMNKINNHLFDNNNNYQNPNPNINPL